EGPPESDPIFTNLYWAASCSCRETGAPCACARDSKKEPAQTTATTAGITLFDFCHFRAMTQISPLKLRPAKANFAGEEIHLWISNTTQRTASGIHSGTFKAAGLRQAARLIVSCLRMKPP